MKKNIVKKITLILFIIIIIFSINSKAYAAGGWSEIIEEGKSFIDAADSNTGTVNITSLQETSGYLYNILLAAGVVIAVIVATILGIQFMTGGAEGQAKVKEMLVPFVVGCVVVFGGFAIWKLAVTIGNRFESVADASYVYEIENTSIEIAEK